MKLWGSEPATSGSDRPYVVVKSHDDVAELAAAVLDPGREDLVVVLTSRQDEREPSLDVEDVRAIVGPSALIYFMLTGRLSLDLGERVPDRRGPFNGSMRVWLPGADIKGHPREHPQVFDPTGEYGPRSLRQLAYGLRDAFRMRGFEPQVEPVVAHRSLDLIRVVEEAEMAKLEYEEQLTLAHKERDEAVKGEREADRRLRMAQRDRGVSQVSAQDPEGALMELILQRWLETLSLEGAHPAPPGPVRAGPRLRALRRGVEQSRARSSRVCLRDDRLQQGGNPRGARTEPPTPQPPRPPRPRLARQQPVGVAVPPDTPGLPDSTGSALPATRRRDGRVHRDGDLQGALQAPAVKADRVSARLRYRRRDEQEQGRARPALRLEARTARRA